MNWWKSNPLLFFLFFLLFSLVYMYTPTMRIRAKLLIPTKAT